MQNKIYFLLAVFLLIVVQSTSLDSFNRKGGKYNDDDDDDGDYPLNKHKYDRLKDDPQQLSTFHRNRYSPYDSSPNNYRTRSRWPSSYDDRYDSNDWSQYGYGLNNHMPNFPGPLPPAAFDTGAYLSNGPSCYSLLDPQYPLFSDICGAVPQARYSLPNSFGHLERWQIAQVLTAILGPSTPTSGNPACTRSLRLLLCPLLFPPCPTRFEAPPVLPCQPFCRLVKNQCAAPSLDLLPCDLLPPTSDLCPINPSPYSSLLSSFGQPLPFNGGLSSPGFPQSALSSLLAQSAFSSDMPSSTFSSMLPPSQYSSAFAPSGVPSPSFSSMFSSSGGPQSAFPSFLQSSGGPQSPMSSFFSPSGGPQSSMSSFFSPSGLSLSPINPNFNTESYMPDSLTPILVDFPPLQYTPGYKQAGRYFPVTRSANERV